MVLVHCFGSWSPPLLRPPDIIHVMNAPRPSPFFFSRVLLLNTNGKLKAGRPWKEATDDQLVDWLCALATSWSSGISSSHLVPSLYTTVNSCILLSPYTTVNSCILLSHVCEGLMLKSQRMTLFPSFQILPDNLGLLCLMDWKIHYPKSTQFAISSYGKW